MKKLLTMLSSAAILLAVVLLCAYALPTQANAATIVDSGTCGENLTWTLDDAGTLTISGTGAMKNYESVETWDDTAPWWRNPNVKKIVIGNNVTSIGRDAFYDCYNVTSVTIGSSVTTIGRYAFGSCDSLTSLTIPDSVIIIGEWAFAGCKSLPNMTIGNSVTTIEMGALANCTSLTSVILPKSLTNIGDASFGDCDNLTDVYYAGTQVQWDKINIGEYNDSLTNATIHYNAGPVTIIDSGKCGDNLTWTLDSEGTLTISGTGPMWVHGDRFLPGWGEECAFDYLCDYSNQIVKVIIEDGVTTIGDGAFFGCTSLTSVTIPDSVTAIGYGTFAECESLTDVTIGNSVTIIGEGAFNWCSSLKIVIIPDSVITIEWGAFLCCPQLTNVMLGNNVTTIGDSAFEACGNLTSITIPDSVTTIGDYAFCDCNSLVNVYYTGTQAQWDAIGIGSGNDPLLSATLYTEACTHNYDFGENVEEPTCTQSGLKVRTCFLCGETEDVEIPALGHAITNHAGQAATCLNTGWSAYQTCSRCDYSTYKEIPALGHNITHHAAQAATCAQIGWNAYDTCSRCDYSTYQEIPAVGGNHTWGEWIVQTAATNTTAGSKYHICTNCSLQEDKTIPQTLRFQAGGLTLKSNIQVNFKVQKAMFDTYGYTDAYAVFELNGRKTVVDTYRTSGSYYSFDFIKLSPAMLGDTITATLYAKYDGEEYVSESKTYSVLQYCVNQLNNPGIESEDYTAFRTMLVDMLNYGAAAQKYVNYKTNDLVNENLTATQKAWGTAVDTAAVNQRTQADDHAAPTVEWKGGKLLLNDRVAVVVTIQAADLNGLTIVMRDSHGKRTTYTAKDLKPTSTADRYELEVTELGVGQMREKATFVAYCNGEQVSKTMTYSIQSYVATKGTGTDKLAVLLRAMLRYGDAARAYALS